MGGERCVRARLFTGRGAPLSRAAPDARVWLETPFFPESGKDVYFFQSSTYSMLPSL